jgi:hypothetical protein
MSEPGLDLHEWTTRWEELQEELADDLQRALPDAVRLIEQMLTERGYELREPVTAEGEDADIIRNWLAAREVAMAAEQDDLDPADVEVALDDLREIYDYIVEDRPMP